MTDALLGSATQAPGQRHVDSHDIVLLIDDGDQVGNGIEGLLPLLLGPHDGLLGVYSPGDVADGDQQMAGPVVLVGYRSGRVDPAPLHADMQCAAVALEHPDFDLLGGRVVVERLEAGEEEIAIVGMDDLPQGLVEQRGCIHPQQGLQRPVGLPDHPGRIRHHVADGGQMEKRLIAIPGLLQGALGRAQFFVLPLQFDSLFRVPFIRLHSSDPLGDESVHAVISGFSVHLSHGAFGDHSTTVQVFDMAVPCFNVMDRLRR